MKTFWLAKDNRANQWVVVDLLRPASVNAIQINYFDYKSGLYGRVEGLRHRYVIECSLDGNNWEMLIDKSNS